MEHAWSTLTKLRSFGLTPSSCICPYSCNTFSASPCSTCAASITFHTTTSRLGSLSNTLCASTLLPQFQHILTRVLPTNTSKSQPLVLASLCAAFPCFKAFTLRCRPSKTAYSSRSASVLHACRMLTKVRTFLLMPTSHIWPYSCRALSDWPCWTNTASIAFHKTTLDHANSSNTFCASPTLPHFPYIVTKVLPIKAIVYALMQAFNSERRTKDVVSIITSVTHEVASVEVEDEESGEVYSQCPILVSSLRKPLYWRNDKV